MICKIIKKEQSYEAVKGSFKNNLIVKRKSEDYSIKIDIEMHVSGRYITSFQAYIKLF